jgi:rare lipoprotein A
MQILTIVEALRWGRMGLPTVCAGAKVLPVLCPPGGVRKAALCVVAAWAAVLAGCASRAPSTATDGPGARPPPGLERTPDAEPRVEPVRAGGPNKPYEVLGQRYVPMPADAPLSESGLASWYGRKFHGQPTSSGETYDMYAMTAAHKTMPIPSYARVRNPANGREVIVRINDRGPFAAGRVIDLSYTAALRLGVLNAVAPVEVQRITHAEIRAGLKQPPSMPAASTPVLASPPSPAPLDAATAALAPEDPPPGDRSAAPGGGAWLQIAAFRTRDAAAALQQRLLLETADLPGVALVEGGGWIRVQAGPYPNRGQALQASEQLQRQYGFAAVVIQRTAASPSQ